VERHGEDVERDEREERDLEASGAVDGAMVVLTPKDAPPRILEAQGTSETTVTRAQLTQKQPTRVALRRWSAEPMGPFGVRAPRRLRPETLAQ